LDAFGTVRSARSPPDYIALLLEGVMKNICLLRADRREDSCTADEVKRVAHDLFDPIKRLIDQGKATGESLEREVDEKRGASVVDPDERARIVYAYCHDAELAYESGNAISAWTLIVDAMRVAADLKVSIVYRAGGVYRASSEGKKAGAASHAKSGHATPETKELVRQLWRKWRAGEYPNWNTQEKFAEECLAHLNGAKVSTDTILKKWIPGWMKEERGEK
jgi:hypothetical protein